MAQKHCFFKGFRKTEKKTRNFAVKKLKKTKKNLSRLRKKLPKLKKNPKNTVFLHFFKKKTQKKLCPEVRQSSRTFAGALEPWTRWETHSVTAVTFEVFSRCACYTIRHKTSL